MSKVPMHFILILFTLLCACPSYAKVYDCFPFFNELELLKVRLAELNDHVDYFVLVESVETQRGDPKPLYFQENRHLFEKYLHKIIHVIVNERITTNEIMDDRGFYWDREMFQRECIKRGLLHCDDLDVILISDLDEIPRPEVVETMKLLFYREKKKPNKLVIKNPPDVIALEMPLFMFQLNSKSQLHGGKMMGTVATLYRNIKNRGPQFIRRHSEGFSMIIENGGWHFTWMGGKDKIRQKFLSVVEGREKEEVDSISDEEIESWVQSQEILPIDGEYPNDFPEYIKKNIDHFRSIGFIAE